MLANTCLWSERLRMDAVEKTDVLRGTEVDVVTKMVAAMAFFALQLTLTAAIEQI